MAEPFPNSDPTISDRSIGTVTRAEELAYELRIEEVMTHIVVALTPDMMMTDVLEKFRQIRISGAPVVDQRAIWLG